ncbi:tetratricopeptide repeat-containing sulfotransferase family protein [Colwellia piezophila]|uniref:tetratricopeptide repeat-containing sulfotransferase family protein n=1 Tax=Colwellia piezophila TaxID=211668 RepID=UPI0003671720|nr:sulfotransferase [Colwellia piezophila]
MSSNFSNTPQSKDKTASLNLSTITSSSLDKSSLGMSSLDISSSAIEQALDHVWSLINKQAISQANTACAQLNRSFPDSADAWYASSFLALQLKNFSQAIVLIDNAITLAAQNAQWQLHKAQCFLIAGKVKPAQVITEQLINNQQFNNSLSFDEQSTDDQNIDNFAELALILNKLENFAMAAFYYQKAIDLIADTSKQRKAQLYFNLAAMQRYLGQIDEAEASLTAAITLNPDDYEAYLLRSSLKNQTTQANHITELETLLTKPIKHPMAKAQVYYALAKEHEDLGDKELSQKSISHYQKSFDYLTKGAQSRRSNIRYHVAHDIETMDEIIRTFTASFFEQQADKKAPVFNNDEAIFVLGLPRTGSTLVDRILSNHSDVFSAGELNDFALQMMAQVKKYCFEKIRNAPKSKADLVSITTDINFATLGRSYIESTRISTGKTKHFIDKSPLNSLYVGLIHLALPQAKIIHVTRHPLDTCYAIYKQLFTQGYPFSYDLQELGQYYIAHHKMMLHWQEVMPGVIYHIAYEEVVNNIEEQAKALIQHCDLSWQRACFDFQKNQSPSTTASATQVRQGLYKSSQGKWQHFSAQLAPLKRQLEQAGICCD